MKNKLVIIMPAYNEAKIIGNVICDLKSHLNEPDIRDYDPEIVVIDDGSTDDTAKIASASGVTTVSLLTNCGLGAALGTGFQIAKRLKATVAITFDSDGQHDPSDISRLIAPIITGEADVVVGSRLINHKGMPTDRIIINKIANFITWVLFGVKSTDSQSGLRAFNKDALEKINIKTNRMEVSSEILSEIHRNKLRYSEVPIKVIYSEYSRKKGQQNLNGLTVLFKLVLRRMR